MAVVCGQTVCSGNLRFFLMIMICSLNCVRTQMNAFRVEDPSLIARVSPAGLVSVETGQKTVLRLFSPAPFSDNTQVSFTTVEAQSGTVCDDMRSTEILNVDSVVKNSAVVTVFFHSRDGCCLMFCLRIKENGTSSSPWIHQGNSSWLQLGIMPVAHNTELLPVWAKSILIVVFVCISGFFSALALILLSLSKSELKLLRNHGTSKERRYVKTLTPLRKRGNYLLCTILLINTLANVVVTTLFYELIGLYTLLAATICIVFLGEVLPQIVSSWCGLLIGAKTVWFTNVFLILTFPVSYPVSKLMDLLLAYEIPCVYNRDRLHELFKLSNTETEVKLEKAVTTVDLSTKCVRDIMTKLDDVSMVEFNSKLTSDMLNQILRTGYTRIPVYEKDRTNIVALLHVKDLALLDPESNTSLKTLCKFYNHPVNFVFEDTKLNVMLEEFKKGQSHMAFVQRVNSEGSGDPFYETLGMVTLEDVIEDIFQSETSDESTIILEKKELMLNLKKRNVNSFPLISNEKNYRVSTKALQAARSYLSTSLGPFHPQWISEKVLERMADQSAVVNLELSDPSGNCYIYENGKVSDSFVLILDGHVQIDIGNEHLQFTDGPFAYFGLQVLTDAVDMLTASIAVGSVSEKVAVQHSHYIPDFTLRAITDVRFLRITKAVYFAGLRATLLQHQPRCSASDGESFPPDYSNLNFSPLTVDPQLTDVAEPMGSVDLAASSRTKLLAPLKVYLQH